jgi:hypothetical protein
MLLSLILISILIGLVIDCIRGIKDECVFCGNRIKDGVCIKCGAID